MMYMIMYLKNCFEFKPNLHKILQHLILIYKKKNYNNRFILIFFCKIKLNNRIYDMIYYLLVMY